MTEIKTAEIVFQEKILDKCQAIFELEAGTKVELAEFLGKPWSRVWRWVEERKFKPNWEIGMKIEMWVTAKESQMRKSKKVWSEYQKKINKTS